MSGDTTYGALERLTYMPERTDESQPQGDRIAGQYYYDIDFTGGSIANVNLTDVTINGVTTQRNETIITDPGDYTVQNGDYVITVDKIVPEVTTITLPLNPGESRSIIVKDGQGEAGDFNITVDPNGQTIDSQTSFILDADWQAVEIIYNGTEWNVLNSYKDSNSSGGVVGPIFSTDNAITRFDGITGQVIQNSGVVLSDTDVMTMPTGGQILLDDSITTAGLNLPLAFDGDTDTGFYRPSANNISVAANATELMRFQGSSATAVVRMMRAMNFAYGSTLASASSVDLGSATGNTIMISGNVTINGFGGTPQVGSVYFTRFTGTPTLTSSATLVLFGANISVAVGDQAAWTYEGSSTWRCLFYTRANGTSLFADVVGPASSTDNAIARFDGLTGKIIQNSGATINDSGILTASGFIGPLTGNVTGNVSGSSGSTTGNAATTTALQTARNIGGVSFNGTADIVPQTIQIVDAAADTTTFPMLAGSATGSLQPLTDAGLTYNASTNALTAGSFIGPLTGNVTGNVSGSSGSTTGNAATATALQTARAIGIGGTTGLTATGVNFDGTAAINPALTGTLIGANGGTGQSTTAVGDLLQGNTGNTWQKLSAVATGNVLLSGGVTTASSWGKVGLTTHVSGTLPEGNGGTNQTTYTTGDILYASASNTLSKLGIGSTGQVVTVAGGVPTWATPSAGATYMTTVTASGQTALNFTSIPTSVRQIFIVFNGLSTSGTSIPQIQIGGGGYDATGYRGSASYLDNTSSAATAAYVSGILLGAVNTAVSTWDGMIILTRQDLATNVWEASGQTACANIPRTCPTAGTKTTTSALNQLRIINVNGTDTFDAGSVNVIYS